MHVKQQLDWKVGHSDCLGKLPDKWVQASVPGAANLDWILGNNLPDWKQGVNFKQYKWMEECFWVYQTNLPMEKEKGYHTLLRGKGIDYEYEVKLDGETIYYNEGMFSPFCLDLTGKNGELEIWIYPVPKDQFGSKDTREEAAQVCKPAVSYGWDWHPRLIPMGIWDELVLTKEPYCRFKSAEVVYTLSEDFKQVTVTASAEVTSCEKLKFSIASPKGETVYTSEDDLTITIDNPMLWWCNGYGEPNLYTWKLECIHKGKLSDSRSGKVGFRKISMEMNEGSWEEPQDFPKGRSVAPITIQLNGVPVFAKGSNWVNPEVFVGTISYETYKQQIDLAKKANFNILRCWGGAIINKDDFFKICDKNGIMVWQEFMLACNNYRGTKQYLKVLEQEATAIIKRLRQYTCVVMWCGGNELFNNWSGMTDQSLALRLLNKLCYDLDPQQRPFLMTSPLFGMAHGCYLFCYPDGREVFEVMPASKHTAYTEFGVPSISNLECCMQLGTPEDIFPLVPNQVTIAHHAFGAWHAAEDTWCGIHTIKKYLGEPENLQQLIDWSQWLQGEGYKCIFEEARRQKPYCSMAINWCYNEPWPTLANNSILNYGGIPKKSYQDVSDACRPVLASAQIPKFSWLPGEVFEAALWLLNDGVMKIPAGEVKVKLQVGEKIYSLLNWEYSDVDANTNLIGPVIRFQLPELECMQYEEQQKHLNLSPQKKVRGSKYEKMQLILQAGTQKDPEQYSSRYTLIFYGKE